MYWAWFILGFLFGVLASFTVVYLIVKSTALWIKKHGVSDKFNMISVYGR